jgi:4-phospho-D-threonate 3-dehydrogenase / 4-phospho-D-erythronate 3-dehydrogenase
MTKPRIAVTMGDPAGVGPELCLRILNHPRVTDFCTPIVFGDAGVLKACANRTDQACQAQPISIAQIKHAERPSILDLRAISMQDFVPGTINAATGRASFAYVEQAIQAALDGSVAAVTTGPLSKEALFKANIDFPGHTEIFALRTNAKRSCMMQYSEAITCTFVTVHVGYHEVPGLLTVERILDVIDLTVEAIKRIRRRKPRIVVCGLNPHAGEHGLFGNREEERIIIPAIEVARKKGIDIEGPLPPDTAFLPWKRQATDAFICMYHDQGHIPVKALAFDSAVNTTLGLPIIRTSVDHGTALDIAWQGKARFDSLVSALQLASQLADDI